MAKKNYRNKQTEMNISNQLIEAKYLLSPFSKDIMNLAITRMEETNNPDAPLKADMYNSELYRIFGTSKKNNITRELNKVKDEIQECKIVIDDGHGGFDSYIIAPTCRYHNGVFTVEFNSSLRDHTLILKSGNFSQISIISSGLLKSFFSKRIYEILKKEYYKLNPKDLHDHVSIIKNLSELRFSIGIANQSEPEIEKYINKCKRENEPINWDYAYNELCKEKSYERWQSLESRIIAVAKEEIEKYTEIRFEYERLKGMHGKVVGLEFTIYPNQPSPEVVSERLKRMKAMQEGESEFYKQQNINDYLCRNICEEFADHKDKFGMDEVIIFMNDAGNDEELVRWAIMDTDEYGEKYVINNYIGCVRDRIKNPHNYKKNISVANGSVDKGAYVQEYVNEDKDQYAEGVWEKTKKNDDFDNFVYAIEEHYRIDFVTFEEKRTPKEMFELYTDFKTGRAMKKFDDLYEDSSVIDTNFVEEKKSYKKASKKDFDAVDSLLGADFYDKAWEKIKKEKEFSQFIKWCEHYHMSLEDFELMKGANERITLYNVLKSNDFVTPEVK